ncbi:MAG: hypothetical protein ACRDT6_16050 [Micromonosporaceae bacterium]
MSGGDTARTGGSTDLYFWIDQIPDAFDRLRDDHLPEEIQLDYTIESLSYLETGLVDYTLDGERALPSGFCDDAMAYLGEVLLTIGGGAWGWDTAASLGELDGEPVVCPDEALGLAALAPLLLIEQALTERTGQVFSNTATRLAEAVAALREQRPGWEPVKQHTHGVDPLPEEPRHPWLAGWLAKRERTFAAWTEETGKPAAWDFSPESLDVLGGLVRDRFATEPEFEAAEDALFLQGAAWYVGEVARRERGAVWTYRDRDEDAMWTGEPIMTQPGVREGNTASPMSELYACLEFGPAMLREALDSYVPDSEAQSTRRP